MKQSALTVAAVLVLVGASPAAAADKAHQQLMAEIRMLQEQQQQLQQMMGMLAETLKTVSTKIDDQTAANRKSFADQKLQVDNVADGVRVLREKADDTNVRLSTVSQELEAVRQAMSSMPTAQVPPPAPGAEPSPTGEPGAAPTAAAPVPTTPPGSAPFISPQRMYDNAYSDYAGGQFDIAIQGFNAYIASFPKSDKADDAQLNIGNAYYGAGKQREAIDAYQKVISNYPNSDSIPVAYYKLGVTYNDLKQPDLARRAFETVMQKYPAAPEAFLAKQRLDALNRK
ncbi:MAG TPA: tol-pal system protein YbgF [Vicinamibacterales bacterium]|nr:tol-pal system protein YbgF [Vicinamibacterales bacterium]